MKAIAIVDASVLCELLDVPGKSGSSASVVAELRRKVDAGEYLFLSMVSVIETGNHIGHVGNGTLRRRCAEALVALVADALVGKSPFVPLGMWDEERVQSWLREFPDWASRGTGLGDLAIKKDWEHLCDLNLGRRVYIWSLDRHLASFDQPAAIE